MSLHWKRAFMCQVKRELTILAILLRSGGFFFFFGNNQKQSYKYIVHQENIGSFEKNHSQICCRLLCGPKCQKKKEQLLQHLERKKLTQDSYYLARLSFHTEKQWKTHPDNARAQKKIVLVFFLEKNCLENRDI